MKFFQRIDVPMDTFPLLHAVQKQEHLFNSDRFRTTFPGTPHVDVDDILLRFSDTEKCTTTSQVIGGGDLIWHPGWAALPQARPLISNLMHRVGGYELGRVLISRIRPGGKILPHADNEGTYVHTPDRARYHIVLQGFPGSLYHTGDETVCMTTGQTWWFDALTMHSVENNSADDRIHMLVDLRCYR